ncbi:CsbD family protein [Burkholderia stabilis]|uniref:CsbD-like domain-containing protein n=1 Tax=Burkholderia stabilis TaxID=95485 RepID=A0AAJ5NDN8_9BURK|nr:CsbD family protein [Burkholderia stabilis]VBB16509.1 hypothetical protein,CsbD-like [Burkholderia stabilis]
MNKDQVRGIAKKARGKVNEVIGRVTGNATQEIRGDAQQAAGEVQKKFGDAREAIRKQAKKAH